VTLPGGRKGQSTLQRALRLLGVNFIVLNPLLEFLTIYSKECFYSDFHPFPPVIRHQDRHGGVGFWRRGKGGPSSLTHKAEKCVPLIGDLDMVALPGTAPTQGPHLLCPSLGSYMSLSCSESVQIPDQRSVRAHPRPYEFTRDLWIGTPHLLDSQAMSHSHTFTCRHPVSPPCTQSLGVMV
jgi:hypothetical protein